MKTILNTVVSEATRGILYLCDFNGTSIKVIGEKHYTRAEHALWDYAEIPNPESQLITGSTHEEVCMALEALHKNMENKQWLKNLKESL